MVGGLPWTAWLLLVASVGPGLLLVATYYFRRTRSTGRE